MDQQAMTPERVEQEAPPPPPVAAALKRAAVRREANRKSARESRQRKKARLEELKESVDSLTKENSSLMRENEMLQAKLTKKRKVGRHGEGENGIVGRENTKGEVDHLPKKYQTSDNTQMGESTEQIEVQHQEQLPAASVPSHLGGHFSAGEAVPSLPARSTAPGSNSVDVMKTAADTAFSVSNPTDAATLLSAGLSPAALASMQLPEATLLLYRQRLLLEKRAVSSDASVQLRRRHLEPNVACTTKGTAGLIGQRTGAIDQSANVTSFPAPSTGNQTNDASAPGSSSLFSRAAQIRTWNNPSA